ncbi:MAG: tetratricopeptide repeat protein [Candidatus Kapabacteria bacterium]|nr:tetratricopeptide repeat protein [Candidatus Kapabacteria bacterium]
MTSEVIQKVIEKIENLLRTFKNEEAKELAFELLEQHEILDDVESLAKVYSTLGIVYYHLSDFINAIEYFDKEFYILQDTERKEEIAHNLKNIGTAYASLNNNVKALECFEKALQINEEIGRKDGIASNYGNIGIIYSSLNDYSKALEYYEKALQTNEEIGRIKGIPFNLGNIANVYSSLFDYSKALEYNKKALAIFEEIGHKVGVADKLHSIGIIYRNFLDYPKAIEYYKKALFLNEEMGRKAGIAANLGCIGNIYSDQLEYPKALEHIKKSLDINKEIGNKIGIAYNLLNLGVTYKEIEEFSTALEYIRQSYSIAEENKSYDIMMNCIEQYSQIYEKKGDIVQAFSYYKQYIALKDEIQSKESKNKALLFDQRRKIEEDEKARQLKLARFQEQEKILHNILPINIADRILNQETFIADHFQSVSVLFMDLVGFTSLSSIAPPKQLVYLLDTIFTKADEVVESFGLEKIKTIGDGYLAVANVTTPLEHHQKATALAALKLLETMKDFTVNIPSELGNTDWIKNMKNIEIRIGIHTGEIVAGIIGKNKYTYDLWGDAVNVASRMESNSEAGRIHISDEFAHSIESHSEFSLIPRGEITIKGKGTMNTFWLEKGI